MNEMMNFSEHVDVMVGKAFAMLGFIRRLSFKFRDTYTLTRMNMCSAETVYTILCMVWVGRILMIYHHMSIYGIFCALTIS
jgi:hypothetical protein